MDIRTTLILIDGKDRTAEIEKAECVGKQINIRFNNSFKTYSYNLFRVKKFDNPKIIELNDKIAYVNDMPIYKPEAILDFGEYTRIIEYNRTRIVPTILLKLLKNGIDNLKARRILSYLKEIANHLPTKPNEDAFLKREMDRLTFVHPDSVLNSYLNCKKIQNNELNDESIIFPFSFNLSQKVALENALSHSISVIEGPPGTGKTQTILNIIANLVVRKKSVAVVSNNNEAVKNIIEKMNKKQYSFMMAMLGRKENQEYFFSNMPKSNVSDWCCGESVEELKSQIEILNKKLNYLLNLDRQRAKIKQQLLSWKLEQEHFEKYYSNQNVEEILKLPLLNKNPDKIIEFLAETSYAIEYEKTDNFLFKLKLLLKYRIFNYKKLKFHEMSLFLRLEKEAYIKQIEKLEKNIKSLDKKLDSENFKSLLVKHQEVSQKIFRQFLYDKYCNDYNLNFTIKNFKVIFNNFIEIFPVILSTTHSLRNSIPENYLMDYVIIDESSQVDIITGILALSCCRNIVIVGDTKQLPQITDKKIQKQINNEVVSSTYDYFNHSILSSIIDLYKDDLPRIILREHYRCHPKIIEFCNQKYYNGELIPYTDNSLSKYPLILYKTTPGNHMRRVTNGEKKGVYNQRELDVISEEVLARLGDEIESENIGIVTPYRKQADNAMKMVCSDVVSDTVHKYQGREKDVIIMSTVLDSTLYGQMGLKFVDDPQMVNVAVSRAIRQFILVTDNELFYKKGDNISELIRYIMYSTLDENVVESRIVSVFDLLYKSYSSKLNLIKSKMNNNVRYKSEEIIRILLEEIFKETSYNRFTYAQGVLLRNLLNDDQLLTEDERNFINNRASLDFVIYYKQDKTCALVIEVDGFEFHENNPKQLQRDKMKNEILNKYKIPFLRLPTNGSSEKEKICIALNKLIDN